MSSNGSPARAPFSLCLNFLPSAPSPNQCPPLIFHAFTVGVPIAFIQIAFEPEGDILMATSIAAPNLHRAALLEFEFSYDSNGIISVIDDLVERVMSVHMKKPMSAEFLESDPAFSLHTQDDVVAFPSSGTDFCAAATTAEEAA
jgi:hypothetical protein